MYVRKSVAASLLLLTTTAAQAELEPILTVGYESGGDDLVQTTATDLSAGGGLAFGAGLSFSRAESSLSLRVMIHYLFDAVEFTSPDGEADTEALPLELALFKRWQRHEFGIGPSIHFNPSYEISSGNPALNGQVDFDTAAGVFLQYNYIFSQAATATYTTDTYLALKLRAMDYETAGATLDADSIGLYLGAKF